MHQTGPKDRQYIPVSALLITALLVSAVSVTLGLVGLQRPTLDGETLLPRRAQRTHVSLDLATGNVLAGYSDDRVAVYDTEGEILWSADLENAVLTLSYDNGGAFVSDDSRQVYSFDARSGRRLQRSRMPYRPIAVSGEGVTGRLLVGTTLTAFRNELRLIESDGSTVFSVDPDGVIVGVHYHAESGRSFVLLRDGTVQSFDEDGRIVDRYDLANYPLGFEGGFGFIVLADELRNVHLLSLPSLRPVWMSDLDFTVTTVGVANDEGSVVAASADGRVAVLDPAGKVMWKADIDRPITRIWGGSGSHDLVVFTADGAVVKAEETAVRRFTRALVRNRIFRIAGVGGGTLGMVLLVASFVAKTMRANGDSLFHRIYRSRQSYFLLVPTVGLLLLFNYYPSVSALAMAFAEYLPGSHFRWVGLRNFSELLANDYFWVGMRNMALFLVTDMFKFLVPPLLAAELLLALRNATMKYWIRVLFYLPAVLPGVAALLVWTQGMLGIDGAVNGLLQLIGLGEFARPWLADPDTAMISLIFIGFPWVGTFYIIFYGALISIPDSLFDAAKIDGCGWFRRVFLIDLPHISPQIKFVMVAGFIASIQDFQRVFVTTHGGPGQATYIPMLELYFQMSRFRDYGLAAAMGVVLFIVLFAGTVLNLRLRLTR